MVKVKDKEHFQQVARQARAHGLWEVFKRDLRRLLNYGIGGRTDRTRIELFWDFAPLSFRFLLWAQGEDGGEYKMHFNGGLIYQGPDVPADGLSPSLTVSLNPSSVGWFMHT